MIVNGELARSQGCTNKDKWETPVKLFQDLNNEFNFTLDPCCETETAKCNKFYTDLEDGLKQDWSGERVYVNPPYSKNNIDKWMQKCYEESKKGTLIVALIPVSTSSKWFHNFVWNKCELRFIKGRIRFIGGEFTAPFSSCLAIYNGN